MSKYSLIVYHLGQKQDEDLGFSVNQLTFNTFPGTITLLAKETAKHTKSYQLYYLANFTSKLENMA